mmetsp:Transcript_107776/g.232072  ORF Transcript_107776/g.232072 Transcript_107776/m.232072 type:complete len:343 (-) Transcript_107776:85-1113(-)
MNFHSLVLLCVLYFAKASTSETSVSYCPPFYINGSGLTQCEIIICPGQIMTANVCDSVSGQTKFILRWNGNQVASSFNNCFSGTQLRYQPTESVTDCDSFRLEQQCWGTSACGGTTTVTIDGTNAYQSGVVGFSYPTTLPSSLRTFAPSISVQPTPPPTHTPTPAPLSSITVYDVKGCRDKQIYDCESKGGSGYSQCDMCVCRTSGDLFGHWSGHAPCYGKNPDLYRCFVDFDGESCKTEMKLKWIIVFSSIGALGAIGFVVIAYFAIRVLANRIGFLQRAIIPHTHVPNTHTSTIQNLFLRSAISPQNPATNKTASTTQNIEVGNYRHGMYTGYDERPSKY